MSKGGNDMTKSSNEIAAEIVVSLIQARGEAIGPTSSNRADYLKQYLSDEAIADTYKNILSAVLNPNI